MRRSAFQAGFRGDLACRAKASGVATLSSSAGDDALHIRYRLRNGEVWLGTNAYFFSEGSADRYAEARYGEFHLDRDSGEAVLVGLEDEAFNDL